jgi:hypothetical protein
VPCGTNRMTPPSMPGDLPGPFDGCPTLLSPITVGSYREQR